MQNLNKKAMSNVISSILIILLSLTLIVALTFSIINLVKSPSLSPENSCQFIQFKNILKIQDVCYDNNTQDVLLTIRRSSDKSIFINSMDFILNTEEKTETLSCGNQCGTCKILNLNKITTYRLESNGNEDSITLKLNNCILETKEISSCN